jgi:ATP-dependent Clp protease ATP-binding subunit ClpA
MMFERFTRDARDAVTGSVASCARAGDDAVTEEHLLLALLDQRETPTAGTLFALGVTGRRASLEAALAESRRRGGLTPSDAEALAGLGIDVAGIVDRVERAHGPDALAVRPGGRRRRRGLSGHRPFTPGAKETLVGSLRIALGRGDKRIGGDHLLLALTARRGPVAEALAAHGITYAAVERVMSAPPAARPGPGRP